MHPICRSESHSPSPSRKRMRLSSPTFDDQVAELSQDDIKAFDCLDARLSQSCARPTRPLLVVDDDNPFCAVSPRRPGANTNTSKTERIHSAFTSASVIEASRFADDSSDEMEAQDEAPPETNYAAWFKSDPSILCVGFNTAAAVHGFQRPSINGGSTKGLFVPSASALQEAEEKMRKWQQDLELPGHHDGSESHHPVRAVSPSQATFSSARDAICLLQAPETPTPVSLSKSLNVDLTLSGSRSSLKSLGGKRQTRPFKSPLISTTSSALPHRQVLTPSITSPLRDHHSCTTPSKATTTVSPLRPSSVANHVMSQRPLGFTSRHAAAATRPKFVTPFKSGASSARALLVENMNPRTPSHPRTAVDRIYPPSISSPQPSKQNSERKLFDLSPPPGRQTLLASGLRPQVYNVEQLEDMGINIRELAQVTPQTAPFYSFTTRSRFPPIPSNSSSSLVLDHSALLQELQAKGCTLANQVWVDNHWSLILWKLAGMVALDPLSESDPIRKRWCWPEVIRQFMYRYERDLNSSSRPPLRLITTRDASAESPMVLCISDIILPTTGAGDIAQVQTHPELEVTDGWYRLRARTDAPLARATENGKIKIGRKIAVAGARLSAERKEGCEILEAYSSNVLLLSGNSTHMAPWHAKLGFQRGPFVATLNSLTADGGNVALMMLTVTKAYPVAFVEFIEDADGKKRREGPHDAKEEMRLSTQWKTNRESHASRLWSEYEKRKDRLLDFAERLEQRAGSVFRPRRDDGPPDRIYDFYETLQEDAEAAKTIMPTISHEDAGWLARHIRERTGQEHDAISREIEQELESMCPSREVKTFCVIVAHDTRTHKYPSTRTAQITVWDVPGVLALEGCTKSPFTPGQRYLATNLVPTQPSAWVDRSSGGEVYLSSRKNSKWTLVS